MLISNPVTFSSTAAIRITSTISGARRNSSRSEFTMWTSARVVAFGDWSEATA